ncbi:hypothetical protein B0H10DRAFT_1785950, partial [Mycena sp. CBHHK59/15]
QGCPVIYLSDSPSDVKWFFKAILYGNFFNPPFTTPPPFEVVSSILRLSTKYNVQYLRQRCLRHLSDIFPDSLEAWDSTGHAVWLANGIDSPTLEGYPAFPLLELLRKVDAPWIVPLVVYVACTKPISHIVDGVRLGGTGHMTADKRMLLLAHTEQSAATQSVLRFLSTRFADCEDPDACSAMLARVRRGPQRDARSARLLERAVA